MCQIPAKTRDMPIPLLTSFNIRYFAFMAAPDEQVRQLNPFFPTDGERFFKPLFAQPNASGGGASRQIDLDDLREFLGHFEADADILFRIASQDQNAARTSAL